MQRERAANLLLAPGMPPSSRPRKMMLSATDAHHLPAPTIGARNSKALAVGRLTAPPSSDPELLQKLMRFVRHGLADLEPGSHGYVDERLDVFRRAFGHFTASFGAYAPLLLGVQEAYEDALAHNSARASGVDEVTQRLALMQQETAQLMAHMKQGAEADHEGMATMVAERDTRLKEQQRANDRLQAEVKRLTNDIVHSQRQREESEMRNVELSKQVEHWQAETAEARRQAGGEDNELERVRKEVKTLTDREINFLQEDREQRTLFRETKQELEDIKATSVPMERFKKVSDQLARATASLKASKAEAEELRRILAGGESHSAFPNGLEWAADELEGVAYIDPGWRGRQVHTIIADLVLDILTLHHLSGTNYAQSSANALVVNGTRGPLFTLDAQDGADGSEHRAVVLLQGEHSSLRAAGSGFDGFIRLRPFLWDVHDVRAAIKKIWTEYKRKVLTLQGANKRGASAQSRLMLPDQTAQILHELTVSFLENWKRQNDAGDGGGSGSPERGGAGGGRGAADSSSGHKKEAVHRGLLCADTYNLQASMWRLRGEEPQAAIFCQVCIGVLPPGCFAELHKMCNGLFRSLSSAAVKEKVALDVLRPRLESAIPGASEWQREVIVQKLIVDAGGKDGSDIRLKALEPAPKEPCEGSLPSPVQIELQRLFLILAIHLREDLEAAVTRAALGRLQGAGGGSTNSLNLAIALAGGGSASSHKQLGKDELYVTPRDVRCALLRVDSKTPEPTLADHVTRAFPGAKAVVGSGPPLEGGGGEESGGGAAMEVEVEEPLQSVEEVCARLFAEPMRRFSPRTDVEMRDKLIAALRTADAKSKGKKGKKGKGGGDGPSMVTYSAVRDAIIKVDPKRPEVEVDYVAAHCIATARHPRGSGGGGGAGGSPSGSPFASPPGSPRAAEGVSPAWEGIASSEDALTTPAPLEGVIECLGSSLLQLTTDRHLTAAPGSPPGAPAK